MLCFLKTIFLIFFKSLTNLRDSAFVRLGKIRWKYFINWKKIPVKPMSHCKKLLKVLRQFDFFIDACGLENLAWSNQIILLQKPHCHLIRLKLMKIWYTICSCSIHNSFLKSSCRHIWTCCRHMWRLATRLDNADLDLLDQKAKQNVIIAQYCENIFFAICDKSLPICYWNWEFCKSYTFFSPEVSILSDKLFFQILDPSYKISFIYWTEEFCSCNLIEYFS